MDQPDDLLQAVAKALAGEDGCCCLWDIDGRCCMTDKARAVFAKIEECTGISLAMLESLAADRDRALRMAISIRRSAG